MEHHFEELLQLYFHTKTSLLPTHSDKTKEGGWAGSVWVGGLDWIGLDWVEGLDLIRR